MIRRELYVLTCCLVLLLLLCEGCKESRQGRAVSTSPPPVQQKAAETPDAVDPAIAACKLVTTEEVSAIQGATITDAKSSAGPSGGLLMSQCYYNAKEPNKSVSLAVIQPNPKSVTGSETRDYWASTFARFAQGSASSDEGKQEKNEARSEGREEEEKGPPPKKIDGVGEEAYWSGNRFGGALYVLKRNVILRISIGGPDDQETKITKSKALAEKALSRL
jgi:hypothetical protein